MQSLDFLDLTITISEAVRALFVEAETEEATNESSSIDVEILASFSKIILLEFWRGLLRNAASEKIRPDGVLLVQYVSRRGHKEVNLISVFYVFQLEQPSSRKLYLSEKRQCLEDRV